LAPRANWKGSLKVAELVCPVALFTAASTSERIAFHTLNRKTGHRVHRQFVDQETGDPVEREDQVKGFDAGSGQYIVLEPDEVAAAVPNSDKTLAVSAFIPCREIDDVYFDRPYYLRPDGEIAEKAFTVLREGMRQNKVAALASTVLFRRVRTVLIRAFECGLVATTLNFDYEVRSAAEAFSDIPEMKITGEMLDLAKHIIGTKEGRFDASAFDDRYEAALAELVRAKMEGRPIKPAKQPERGKVIDLMEALRQSAGAGGKPAGSERRKAGAAKGKASRAEARTGAATRRKAS
jgi:DNA end-binding protein Ku